MIQWSVIQSWLATIQSRDMIWYFDFFNNKSLTNIYWLFSIYLFIYFRYWIRYIPGNYIPCHINSSKCRRWYTGYIFTHSLRRVNFSPRWSGPSNDYLILHPSESGFVFDTVRPHVLVNKTAHNFSHWMRFELVRSSISC